MLHVRTVVAMLALLVTITGCGANQQVTRNPDTEALFSAAREGHADTVKALLTSGKPDVNGTDERGLSAGVQIVHYTSGIRTGSKREEKLDRREMASLDRSL